MPTPKPDFLIGSDPDPVYVRITANTPEGERHARAILMPTHARLAAAQANLFATNLDRLGLTYAIIKETD